MYERVYSFTASLVTVPVPVIPVPVVTSFCTRVPPLSSSRRCHPTLPPPACASSPRVPYFSLFVEEC